MKFLKQNKSTHTTSHIEIEKQSYTAHFMPSFSRLLAFGLYVCMCVCWTARSLKYYNSLTDYVLFFHLSLIGVRELMNEIVHIYCLFWDGKRKDKSLVYMCASLYRGSGPIVRRWIDGDVLMPSYEYGFVRMISFLARKKKVKTNDS